MSLEVFSINDKNPNDTVGGGGCLCHPDGKATGCEGPYVIFHAAETDSNLSPHCVVGAKCLKAATTKLLRIERGKDDALAAGEDVAPSA